MMLGAGQTLTPVKDTIALGDGHIHSYAATGPLPHLNAMLRHFEAGHLNSVAASADMMV
jgi:hypothetical protein